MAFDFGNANAQQTEAIQSTEGPLLIIAGPGERVIIVIPHGSAVNTRASAA